MTLQVSGLELRDFRGIRHARVDLDADIVLIYGRNGVGKTALFDAIEYALFGHNRRLERLDPAGWESYLPNVHGDGSFGIHLGFRSGEVISLTGHGQNPCEGSWAGLTSVREFVYERLLRHDSGARRKVAAVHDLALATHLLLQSEMAQLAASGTLDAQKLASLTGSGYLERCREKAAQVASRLVMLRQQAEDAHGQLMEQAEMDLARAANLRTLLARRDRLIAELGNQQLSELIPEDLVASPLGARQASWLNELSGRMRGDLQRARRTVASLRAVLATPVERVAESELSAAVAVRAGVRTAILAARAAAAEALTASRSAADRVDRRLRELAGQRQAVASVVSGQVALQEALRLQKTLLEDRVTAGNALDRAEANWRQAEATQIQAEQRLAYVRGQQGAVLAKLSDLNDAQVELKRANTELVSCASRLTEGATSLSKATEELRLASRASRAAQSAYEREQESHTRATTEVESLRTALRHFLPADASCPLCGTPFGNIDALRHAIDQHTAVMSKAAAAARKRLDLAREALQTSRKRERAARAAVEELAADRAAIVVRDSRARDAATGATARLTSLLKTESDVNRLGTQLMNESKTVETQIAAALEKHREATAELERARDLRRAANSRLGEVANQLRSCEANETHLREALAQPVRDIDTNLDGAALGLLSARIAQDLRSAELERASLASELRTSEVHVGELSARLAVEEQRLQMEEQRLQIVRERAAARRIQLESVGLSPEASDDELQILEARTADRLKPLETIADAMEELARIAASATSSDLSIAADAARTHRLEAIKAKEDLARITSAGSVIRSWEQTLRERVTSAVEDFVIPREEEIDQTFRSLIADPFRFDRVAVQQGSQGELSISLVFRNFTSPNGSPEFYLSAAQMSALTISVFLALARAQTWSDLDTVFLDDPVQHLDDLDCVALLDNLRRFTRGPGARQLIVSTCHRTLYHQMIRKFGLAEGKSAQGMIAMTLEEDMRNGIIVTYDVGGPSVSASIAG